MVSPRPRHAVALPSPVNYDAVRRVLGVKIVATVALWAAPALLLPAEWFPIVGIPEPGPAHLVFVRLLGAAYVALIVSYVLAWRAPARHPGAILSGIVSNGLAALVIFRVGAGGGFVSWSTLGACYIWGSAAAAGALATALFVTGRPLLRRISERPRTMKAL